MTLRVNATGGSIFRGWSGGGCSGTGSCTVRMDQDQTVTATFAAGRRTLNVRVTGENGTVSSRDQGINCSIDDGDILGDCNEEYGNDVQVTLVANPAPSRQFAGWNGGGCSGTNITCTIQMDQDRTVTATFDRPARRTLTVQILGGGGRGGGRVVSVPSGIDCEADCREVYEDGTEVILRPIPARGFPFQGWDGGGCRGTGPCTVIMRQDLTVNATFDTLQ